MTRQYFAAPDFNDPPTASFAAVNTHTTEAVILPPSGNKLWTGIAANDMHAGKVYEVRAGGVMGTTATPTVAYTPHVGINASIADPSFGISATFTTGSGLTNVPWFMEFLIVVRSIGTAISTAALVGTGFVTIGAAAAATTAPAISIGGLTSVTTVDSSVANYFSLGATWSASSASNTHTTQYVVMRSLN